MGAAGQAPRSADSFVTLPAAVMDGRDSGGPSAPAVLRRAWKSRRRHAGQPPPGRVRWAWPGRVHRLHHRWPLAGREYRRALGRHGFGAARSW